MASSGWSLPQRRFVTLYWSSLLALAALAGALILAAARSAYFPGDVALARFVQSAAPLPVKFAQWTTATADKPYCFVLLGLTFFTAWLTSGWRAAFISIGVFFGLWFFGLWLSPAVARPRPSPHLIHVVGHPRGYAFPSIFGLVYVATFGYLGARAATESRGLLRFIIPLAAIAILLLGAVVRIDLGAHWPSDLWVSYLIGLFWIVILLPLAKGRSCP
jgi:membrane-associated phospholipid phosphatase